MQGSNQNDYISINKAREQLGEKDYFAFHKWLVDKGFRNLDDRYVTKEQLVRFLLETGAGLRGVESTDELFGRTTEILRNVKGKK